MKNVNLFKKSLLPNLKNFLGGMGVVVGVDIGFSTLKIVEIKRSKGELTLNNYIFAVIPHAARNDEAQRREFIVKTLKEAKKEGKLTAQGGFLVLGGKEVNVLSLSVPKVAQKDLKSAITIEIKKQLPFDPKKAYFEYQVSSEFSDKGGPKLQIVVAIAQRLKGL